MIVGHGAQRAPGGRLLEKDAQRHHQQRRNEGGDEVLLVDQDAAFENALQHHHRFFRHADVDLVDAAAEDGLADAVEHIGDAQRRHQQRRAFLVDQVAQHQAFDQPGHCEHHQNGHREGQHVGHEQVVDAQPLRDPFGKARHRQGGEQHHRALGEIEHAGGLENQHEAQRHQRVQHAAHEAAE